MEPASNFTAVPKKRRPARVAPLVDLDARTRLGRRVGELRTIYTRALGGVESVSPVMAQRIETAAQLIGVAEQARARYLTDSSVLLDDLVRIERRAASAENALGIKELAPPAKPSLSSYLAGRSAA